MKKRIAGALSAAVLGISLMAGTGAEAAEKEKVFAPRPTCVMMKFTDETRFHRLDSDERFAEMVLDKLLATGKFNLQSTKPVPQDLEAMLYTDRYQEMQDAKTAIENDDLSAVFESPAFSDQYALTLSTAEKGQTLASGVTSRIGAENHAEYLIQGTILSLGKGSWEDADFRLGTSLASVALNYIPGFGGLLSSIIGNMSKADTGFGVMADLRVIRADTGEVVWSGREQARAGKSKTNFVVASSGGVELSETDYVKALDKAADKIVQKLVKDIDENKVFLK